MLEYQRAYYVANAEAVRERVRAWQAANRDAIRERKRLKHEELRAEVLAAYGDACVHCGTTERLELDHVNGGGEAHREAVTGRTHKQGNCALFFRWLRANGFPNDPPLQTLCARCHRRKTGDQLRKGR